MPTVPSKFDTTQGGTHRTVQISVRPDVGHEAVDELADALALVSWSALRHAYGSADDVPALLFAVTVGTDDVRHVAWWELWGNIHHQGTVYEATVPAVPFIHDIAGSGDAEDRVQALQYLREIAVADCSFAADVRAAVLPRAQELVAAWKREPELIQRALLWLSSAYPEIVSRHQDLVRLVPDSLRVPWNEAAATSGYRIDLDHDDMDRQDELERWALAGLPDT